MQELFKRSADSYDRINTVISLGLDRRWREWVAQQATVRPGARVLDAFAGTGRVGLRAAQAGAQVTLADFSPQMLSEAALEARRLDLPVGFLLTDLAADDLQLAKCAYDAVTVSFGVRYLQDPSGVLRRIAESLADKGRLIVLEFVKPRPGPISAIAGAYFFRVLPFVATALGGKRELYDTLVSTTARIHGPEGLEAIVANAGLRVVEVRVMGFGIVVGIVAERVSACARSGEPTSA